MEQDPRLQAVLDIARSVGSTLDLDLLLQEIMRRVTGTVGADRSTLYVVDAETGELWSRVAQGPEPLEIRLPAGQGIAGWVAEHGESVRLDDAYDDPRFSRAWDEITGYRTRSLLCVPFRNASGVVVGVMQCLNRDGGPFTDDDRDLLETIGGQCAVALENAFLYRSLQQRSSELRHANEELRALVEVERAIATARDEGSVVVAALRQLVDRFEAPAAAAVLLGPGSARRIVVQPGLIPEVTPLSVEEGEARVARHPEPTAFASADGLVPDLHIRGIAAPLRARTERVGTVQLLHDVGGYEGGGLRLLGLVAARVARAVVERRQRAARERGERLGLVGQMVSGILHDLRTPMSAVAGYAELMAEEDDPAERAVFAERVRLALAQMEEMTTEILQYTRGTSDPALDEVGLHQLVGDIRDLLRPELERFDLELVLPTELPTTRVRVDAGKIRRVVFNLARNAGQAGASRFVWTLALAGDELSFELADDGPGLPEELRGRLFQPFSTHGKQGGTGLGLAMVKAIVEAHGGTITVRSETGRGTTFSVRLPAGISTP